MIGLTIESAEIDKKIILRLEGRLDASTSPLLEKKLATFEDRNQIRLDFSKVEYLSSAGLRLLLAFTKKLKTKGGFLVLFSINDEVMEIVKLAGFERILNLVGTEMEALQFS